MPTVLYYIHDPMCSWCWGHRPVWDALKSRLPETIALHYVVGGLAPDSAMPMSAQLQATIQGYWHQVQAHTGAAFNFDFWRNNIPRRSTYMACRAVLAARQQGYEVDMIDAIQQAYYLRAQNPSELTILIGLATQLAQQGHAIDVEQFTEDLHSRQIEQQLHAEIALARRLTAQGFPSMVLQHANNRTALVLDYRDYRPTLQQIQQLLQH